MGINESKLFFFPQNRQFWWYHFSGVMLLGLVQWLTILFLREEKLFNTVASILWVPLFTLATLGFRFFYKHFNWHQQGIARLIPVAILYGLIAGSLVSATMIGITVPFFWDIFSNSQDVISHKTTISEIMAQMILGNAFQTQLFICSWIFIYTSISTNRRVRETELYNLRLQNSLKEAQLASLSNQLNPHFLFNALNNIRFTIHENPDRADAMITALSEILRYSLESSKYEKVSLGEELIIIDRYIEIIKIQMENRLTFNKSLSEEMLTYLVPPMILQLLVENAIKHGVDELRYGGTVSLEGYEEENRLVFIIKNTKPDTRNVTSQNTGIGLANIEQRLYLLYGDKASMKIVSTDTNFSVALILPKESSA